jgi:tetratricopeptide (TPR) repeat protein
VVDDIEQTLDLLRSDAERYPADRYPVQHATARFHLGQVLLEAERTDEALESLLVAARLFEPDDLPVEHAKAVNMAGVALRNADRLDDAAGAFAVAAEIFDAQGEAEEAGAALYNLGVVERDRSDAEAATDFLETAFTLFEEIERPGPAAAAGRELGATLLEQGEVDRAEAVLARATALAEESGDLAVLGSCANVYGLALLAAGRTQEAVESLTTAAGAHPRSIRPEGHAMAKANLALAYEQVGDASRARLAARQALATPGAPEAVITQATATIERLPDGVGDLADILRDEPQDAWATVVGEELIRWADVDEQTRRAESRAWAAALADGKGDGAELAATWLGGLLEQPPEVMERLIASFLATVREADDSVQEAVRPAVSSGMIRFHGPQWMRLKESFNRIASEAGEDPAWG